MITDFNLQVILSKNEVHNQCGENYFHGKTINIWTLTQYILYTS